MKIIQCCIIFILLKVISAKIKIDITAGSNPKDVVVKYSGADLKVVTDHEINLFRINDRNLKEALKKRYGTKPTNVYVKSPTPWGDLYKKNYWEQVTRVLTVKSATVKTASMRPEIVTSHVFENFSNKTIKVNTAISQTVENTVSSSWSKFNELTVSQEIEYDVNVVFEKITARMGISYTSSWGKSEEISEAVTIGSSTSMETKLAPGEAVTSVLSANRGAMEIEVIYKASLKGNVAVNYKRKVNGHHFLGPTIQDVMGNGNLSNEKTYIQTIKVGFYSEATLKVYDKVTGKPI
ncbi:unnamed protein product [Chilo suppressalis]|uniref:Uncharacterized protein n=1 Tax=Chilo suppressalis TaxID=168631 RepID=A0ABN8BAU8_CHISP|nr:unnamed protein product [Chilo suppressalis]